MPIEIGQVEAIFSYPVKSIGGERLEEAQMCWHGLEGDRRLSFRRMDDRGGLPWLTTSKLPELVLFAPLRREGNAQGELPTQSAHSGWRRDGGLRGRLGDGSRTPVRGSRGDEAWHLRRGEHLGVASETVSEIARVAGTSPDVRRFRPNVVGEGGDAPAITVTMRDVRCSMVNLDPDLARVAPEALKAVVRANCAGIYGTVIRVGQLAVGQSIVLHAGG
jgi:uncharacterized protein